MTAIRWKFTYEHAGISFELLQLESGAIMIQLEDELLDKQFSVRPDAYAYAIGYIDAKLKYLHRIELDLKD